MERLAGGLEQFIRSEETNRPVPGAVEVIAINQQGGEHIDAWAPALRRLVMLAAAAGTGAAAWGEFAAVTAQDMKALTGSTKDVIDKVEGLTGQGQAEMRGLAKGAREVDRDRGAEGGRLRSGIIR